jgi:hypothetical protein
MQDEGLKSDFWWVSGIIFRQIASEKERSTLVGTVVLRGLSRAISYHGSHSGGLTSKTSLKKVMSLSLTYKSMCGCGSTMRACNYKTVRIRSINISTNLSHDSLCAVVITWRFP